MQVTAVATQGHPVEHKWLLSYMLRYSLGKYWLTYQESGHDKVRHLFPWALLYIEIVLVSFCEIKRCRFCPLVWYGIRFLFGKGKGR